jgi:hypothetical protein
VLPGGAPSAFWLRQTVKENYYEDVCNTADLTHISPNYIYVGNSKKRADRGDLSTFDNQSKRTGTLEFDTKRRRLQDLSTALATKPKDTDMFAAADFYGGRVANEKEFEHTTLSEALPVIRTRGGRRVLPHWPPGCLQCVCSTYGVPCEYSDGCVYTRTPARVGCNQALDAYMYVL